MKGDYVCEAKWSNETTIASATDVFQIVVKGELAHSKVVNKNL